MFMIPGERLDSYMGAVFELKVKLASSMERHCI